MRRGAKAVLFATPVLTATLLFGNALWNKRAPTSHRGNPEAAAHYSNLLDAASNENNLAFQTNANAFFPSTNSQNRLFFEVVNAVQPPTAEDRAIATPPQP